MKKDSTAFPSPKAFTALPEKQVLTQKFTLSSKESFTFHVWAEAMSDYHRHDNYFEIFIITEGKVLHNFEGEETVMKKGDAFIILPNQYHRHLQYKNYASQHLNLTCPASFISSFTRSFFGQDIFDFPQKTVHFSNSELEVIQKMQNLILHSPSEDSFTAYIQSLLVFAIRLFCQHASGKNQQKFSDMPKWLKIFLQHLQGMDMSEPVQMNELYAVSGVSQTKLSREFKKHIGQTLVSYVNDLKLNYACNLLKTTSFSVAKVSEMCGFENYISFWRVFKAKFDTSPTEYRNIFMNET